MPHEPPISPKGDSAKINIVLSSKTPLVSDITIWKAETCLTLSQLYVSCFFFLFLVKGLAVTIEGGEAHGRLTGFYNSNGRATALKVQRAVKLTAEQGNVKDFITINRVAASMGVWARPKYLVRLQWPLKYRNLSSVSTVSQTTCQNFVLHKLSHEK